MEQLADLAADDRLTYQVPAADHTAAMDAVDRYVHESGIGLDDVAGTTVDIAAAPLDDDPGWQLDIRTLDEHTTIGDVAFTDASGYLRTVYDTRDDGHRVHDYCIYEHDIGATPGEPQTAADLAADWYRVRVWRTATPRRLKEANTALRDELRDTKQGLAQLLERVDGRERSYFDV